MYDALSHSPWGRAKRRARRVVTRAPVGVVSCLWVVVAVDELPWRWELHGVAPGAGEPEAVGRILVQGE